jgi:hypothetical protein
MLTQFFDSIVGEDLTECITEMKFSVFFLLACGAVVKQSEALAGLQAVAKRYFNIVPVYTSLTGFLGSSLQIRLPLVLSTSSATRPQSG